MIGDIGRHSLAPRCFVKRVQWGVGVFEDASLESRLTSRRRNSRDYARFSKFPLQLAMRHCFPSSVDSLPVSKMLLPASMIS